MVLKIQAAFSKSFVYDESQDFILVYKGENYEYTIWFNGGGYFKNTGIFESTES